MYKHFLQSNAWQAFQESQGLQTFRKVADDYEFLAVKHVTKIGSYLYVPYGPSLKASPTDSSVVEQSLKNALAALTAIAKAQKCFFIRIEPVVPINPSALEDIGLIHTKDLNPARTWLLDLTQEPTAILSNMSQGTRTRFNQFKNKGLSVSVTKNPSDIIHLLRLQHQLASEKGIRTFSDDYLKSELSQPFASLYQVHYQPPEGGPARIISASLFFDDFESSTRFYMQSATDSAYKKLPATVGLLTTAIFDAKSQGLHYFDFWGIAPQNAPSNHPWAGFTKFKQSFGGFARDYTGTHDYPLSPAKYTVYSALRKLNLARRKLNS